MARSDGQNRILVVEDEDAVRTLLGGFLGKEGFEVRAAKDAGEALRLLDRGEFDIVLTDLRMPGMDGIALLSEIRSTHPGVGVLMLTGCEDVSLAVAAMKAGALDYLQKPFQLETVAAKVRDALHRQQEKLREESYLRNLERTVEDQGAEMQRVLRDASEATLEALVAALDAREHETHAHSRRVSEFAVHLAAGMGLAGDELEVIRRGAMLHDVGKIGISDTILLKPGPLTDSEWAQMRRHPQVGFWILQGVEPFRRASQIVLTHHERYDGRGYPRHLKGEEIPLGARIFSVADSFDAITSDRPYHRGKPYEDARREIVRNSGTQFDPAVVDAFLRVPPRRWEQIRQRTSAESPAPSPQIHPMVMT